MRHRRIQAIGAAGRCAARSGTAWLLLAFSVPAFALGLGDAQVGSAIGQPLVMTVPLKLDPGVELPQECVRIVPGSRTGDSIPTLNAARISVDAGRHQLRIESLQPVVEPALRVVLEAGCKERIRREFALLLDPPVTAPASGPGAGTEQAGGAEPEFGLGMAQISAVLGQPLSLKVPVVGAGAGSLTADCVRLADPISSEGAPVLRQASIHVLPQDIGALIEVVTPAPVTEPAVRLALDVGCREPLRREYAILLGLPTLAASNVEPSEAAEEPAPPPKPKSAPKRVAKALPPVASVAPIPREPARTPPALAAEPAPGTLRPPAPRSDRLVLASPQEARPGAEAGSDATAAVADQKDELLRRMDTMSKQIEALQAQLVAARSREVELERRASETRSQWTWSMGGVGGVLLGAALAMAWRQRRPQPHSGWEPAVSFPTINAATRPAASAAATTSVPRESMEIGGRATMAPAPTTIPAATEPPITEGRHSPITVTELHDTVQVIKELYATVLERNTAGAATTAGARPERALDLDLRTPTAAGPSAAGAPPARDRPDAKAGQVTPAGEEKRGFEERFTELPTELGLDLDLSSVVAPATTHLVEPAAAPGSQQGRGPARPQPPVASEPANQPFADDHLTTTPTEIAIDIDVGTTTGVTNAPTALEPIDLQLDLSQPETKGKRRDNR